MPSADATKVSPFQAAASRLPPALPHQGCNKSYWHETTRNFPYANLNANNNVPAAAEYVIIGSGLSGAVTAFKLLQSGIDGASILILEAREAVSGSTGRNAGHVRPDAFRGFSAYAALHGKEQALRIVETENQVFRQIRELVEEYHIPCELNVTKTLDVNFTKEVLDDEAQNMRDYVEAGGSLAGIQYLDQQQTAKETGMADALDAYKWTAASIHPAKLAQWLLRYAIDRNVQLWTHCPVTEVVLADVDSPYKWVAQTPQGNVSAQKIVHCTNAYSGLLVPQLSGINLAPVRIQAHSVRLMEGGRANHVNSNTMALRFGLQNFYAFAQMPRDRSIIFGVARPTGITFDDTSYDEKIATEAVTKFSSFSKSLAVYGHHDSSVERDTAWTGLIALTPDKVPYVGEVDELPGQYLCAGFNGHGMANIFACASGVVDLMNGKQWRDTRMPECYQYRRERLKRV